MDKARDIWARLRGRAIPPDQQQWKVIAMCILGATTIWFFTALNKSYTTNINYPLSIIYEGNDTLVVVSELPTELRINVSGGGWNLFRTSIGVGVKPVEYVLNNPTEVRHLPGSVLAPAINDQVKSLRLNRVITDTLHFQIEKKASKRVALKVDRDKIPIAAGYTVVGAISIVPDTALAQGPVSMVEIIGDTLELTITQAQLEANYQDEVSLPDPGAGVSWNRSAVEVSFSVEQLVAVDRDIAVRPLNFPQGHFLDSQQLQVKARYQVPLSLEDSLADALIEIWADFNQMLPDSTIKPRVEVDHPYILNMSLEPQQLSVSYAE